MSDLPYAPTWIAKGRAHALYYARGLYKEIAAKNLFLWAQAIAFKVLVTVVPIVILATGLAGRLLRGEDAFAAVARFINDFLPRNQSEQVVEFLHQLQMSSGTIVGIGGIGLFLSAVSLFITLRIAVGNAFEQDWHEGRSVIGGYLFDVRMVVQVGLLFLVTIGMSVFVQSVDGQGILAVAGLDQPWVREGWQRAIQTTGLFAPFFITTAMFFQLYYLVPKPHPRKRSAFTGALIAGVLWETAKQIFTYYATYVGQFERYATEGLGAIGNTFALIIAFVFWVYFSGIVLMLGAVVASLREHRYVTSGLLPGERPDNATESSPAQPPSETILDNDVLGDMDSEDTISEETVPKDTVSKDTVSLDATSANEPSAPLQPSPARRPDAALAPFPGKHQQDPASRAPGPAATSEAKHASDATTLDQNPRDANPRDANPQDDMQRSESNKSAGSSVAEKETCENGAADLEEADADRTAASTGDGAVEDGAVEDGAAETEPDRANP